MPRRPALISAGLLALVLMLLAVVLPVPYVSLVPGPVTNTLGKGADGVSIITVTGRRTYPTSGRLDLTTVGVHGGPPGPITLAQAVVSWLNPREAVVPEGVVYPSDVSEKVVEQQNTRDMVDSQQDAIAAALTRLGIPFTTKVLVAAVEKGLPAEGRLQVGDVVTSVDGTPVRASADLRRIIGGRAPGDPVRIDVVRKAKALRVDLRTAAQPGSPARPVVGIATDERHAFPFTVRINLKDVGGPSAGLMFALGIVDTLTPGSLTGGRHIAGTGTIDDAGSVGPIGGIEQKIVAARAAGATAFLTPQANCAAAAKNRPDGLRLVRVGSLTDAVTALDALRADRAVAPC